MATEIPLIANRYRILDTLGSGGMGVVYQAYDRLTGTVVALKQVNVAPEKLQFASKDTRKNDTLALALEFRTLAGLSHPHIVEVRDFGFVQSLPFYTMQYVENARTITNYAAGKDDPTKIRLLLELLQAVVYLHRHGILHRDLKPDNVLVTEDGVIKVMDFGLAYNEHRPDGSQGNNAVGTPAYMAPELFVDKKVSVASDLYSIGLIAYELFTGHFPFDRSSMLRLIMEIQLETPDYGSLDATLGTVIARLLSKEPTDRYDNAFTVMQVLCDATQTQLPEEKTQYRESFLQASRLVGRDTELSQLQSALDDVMLNKGSAWLIGGESGVGKTRLIEEVRSMALVAGAQVLRGQAVEGGGLPYQIWRQPMRHLLLSTEVDETEASILKEIVPDMESLVGYAVSDVPPLKGDAHQERLFTAISTVLRRVTAPVVLIVEDLQWAQDSLQPLQHLMHDAAAYPLLLIANFRDDDAPDLPEKISAMQCITLKRLDNVAIAKLSQSILGQGASDKVVDLLQRETEGNVFFIIETIRALAEEVGRLSEIGTKTPPRYIVTGGVQAVVKRRLDRLPQTIRDWLKAVAIAGRQLDFALVQRLHRQSAETMLDFLRQCADAAVMEVRENNWRFAHDKIRETIITHLDDSERQQLHEQVATAIEAQYPDVSAYHEILLEHWYQAGNLEKELHYLRLLASYMVDIRGDYDKIRTLIAQRFARLSDDDPRCVFFLNKMGDSYKNQGRFEEGRIVTEQAHRLAVQHNLKAEIAHSLRILGVIVVQQGQTDLAKDYFQQSLTIFRELGDKSNIATLLIYLGSAFNLQERLEEAREYYEQALLNLGNTNDPTNLDLTLTNLGIIAYKKNQYDEAQMYFQQAETVQRAAGGQYRIGHILLWQSMNQLKQKDENAREILCDALTIATKIKSISLKLFGIAVGAHLAIERKEFELAALWTGCIKDHPAADVGTRYFVAPLLHTLKTILAEEMFEKALTDGATLQVDDIVTSILTQ